MSLLVLVLLSIDFSFTVFACQFVSFTPHLSHCCLLTLYCFVFVYRKWLVSLWSCLLFTDLTCAFSLFPSMWVLSLFVFFAFYWPHLCFLLLRMWVLSLFVFFAFYWPHLCFLLLRMWVPPLVCHVCCLLTSLALSLFTAYHLSYFLLTSYTLSLPADLPLSLLTRISLWVPPLICLSLLTSLLLCLHLLGSECCLLFVPFVACWPLSLYHSFPESKYCTLFVLFLPVDLYHSITHQKVSTALCLSHFLSVDALSLLTRL